MENAAAEQTSDEINMAGIVSPTSGRRLVGRLRVIQLKAVFITPILVDGLVIHRTLPSCREVFKF
jgi:hypothetical protein